MQQEVGTIDLKLRMIIDQRRGRHHAHGGLEQRALATTKYELSVETGGPMSMKRRQKQLAAIKARREKKNTPVGSGIMLGDPQVHGASLETDQHAPAMSAAINDCAETTHDQNEAEVWDEDNTGFKHKLILRSDSFKPKPLFAIPPSHNWFSGLLSPSRQYIYTNRILSARQKLKLALGPLREGTVEFDGDVVIPTLFHLTEERPGPWMSLTPQEMITQRPGFQRASGTVLVGGLGLGWFLCKVHDRDEVERVILVERCRELLDWYGYELCRQLPKVTDVICGDVYDQIGRFGTKAKHLLDIWKLYGECLRDEQFLLHRRRFKHVWGWGEEAAAWGLEYKNGTLVTTN
jgi:hypothetical protein